MDRVVSLQPFISDNSFCFSLALGRVSLVFLPLFAESCLSHVHSFGPSAFIHSLGLEIFIERLPCVNPRFFLFRSYFSRVRLHLACVHLASAFNSGVFPAYLVLRLGCSSPPGRVERGPKSVIRQRAGRGSLDTWSGMQMRGRASLDRQQGVEVGRPQDADERGGARQADMEQPRGRGSPDRLQGVEEGGSLRSGGMQMGWAGHTGRVLRNPEGVVYADEGAGSARGREERLSGRRELEGARLFL